MPGQLIKQLGLRIGQRYTGSEQEDGRMLVSAIGAPVGSGVVESSQEYYKRGQKQKTPQPVGQGLFLPYANHRNPHLPRRDDSGLVYVA